MRHPSQLLSATVFSSALLLASGCGGSAPEVKAAPPVEDRIESSYSGPRMRVAVGAFEELEVAKALMEQMGMKGVGPLITEQITTGLVKTKRVTVLERAQIGKIVGNLQFEKEGDMSKYFDQGTTVESGKFLGAQGVLVGIVTEFEPNVSGGGGGLDMAKIGSAKFHKDKAVVGIEIRLVEQQTGKILAAGSGRSELSSNKGEMSVGYFGIGGKADVYWKTPLGEATQAAAKSALKALIAEVEKVTWEGGVLDTKGPEKIFLDAGEDLNLRIGDRFRVVHRGDPINGPDGHPVGFDDSEAGIVEITQVQPKMSIAKVVEGEGPKKAGDRVRLLKTAP